MAETVKITEEKVKYIALLARIGISDEQATKYAGQMNSILDYMKILEEIDTTGVEATTQVTGLKSVLRDDKVIQTIAPDRLLDCSTLPKMAHQIAVQAVIKEE